VTGQGKREKKICTRKRPVKKKCCETKEKGAARLKKVQVTDLRPVKKVLRD
jgi:hypothetical protein